MMMNYFHYPEDSITGEHSNTVLQTVFVSAQGGTLSADAAGYASLLFAV